MKKIELFIILIAVCLLLIFGIIKLNFNPPLGIAVGENVTLQGVIIKNDMGCAYDADCFVTMTHDGIKTNVIYHRGWRPCANWKKAQSGFQINKSDIIEVYGEVISTNTISICPSKEFYIKKIQ